MEMMNAVEEGQKMEVERKGETSRKLE